MLKEDTVDDIGREGWWWIRGGFRWVFRHSIILLEVSMVVEETILLN